jgi:FKBP-type peptidyl-prolyl cis-trans isomerase
VSFANTKFIGSAKYSTTLIAGVLAAGLCASVAAPDAKIAAPGPAAPAASGFTNLQIVETWGWLVAQDQGLAGIDMGTNDFSIFLKGWDTNLKGGPPPGNLREMFPNLQRLIKARREKLVQATIRTNEARAMSFFALLKKSTNVVMLPNGLAYEMLKPGSGPRPKPGQTVNIHYFGNLLDGTEFAEFGPLDAILVTNHMVCRGWVDALQQVNRGGRMRLYVPPPLPEKDAEGLGVEPGSALVFDIELLDIKDTSPQDLADATVPPAPDAEPPYIEGVTDRQLIEAWGWSAAQQTRVAQFGLGEGEIAALTKGLTAGIRSQPAPGDLRKNYPEVEKFVNGHREKVRAAAKQQRLAEMTALFAGLKKNTNVVELPGGLRYEILKPGQGPYPKPGQTVIVDFTARLIDGTVVDRTDNEPLHIEVGGMTRGFNEGIQKINRGGRIKLYIPPELGFGDVPVSGGAAGVPANSTLIYDIEVREIQDAQ